MLSTKPIKSIVSIIIVSFLFIFTLSSMVYAGVDEANNTSNTLMVAGVALAVTAVVITIVSVSRNKSKEETVKTIGLEKIKSGQLNPSILGSEFQDQLGQENKTSKPTDFFK